MLYIHHQILCANYQLLHNKHSKTECLRAIAIYLASVKPACHLVWTVLDWSHLGLCVCSLFMGVVGLVLASLTWLAIGWAEPVNSMAALALCTVAGWGSQSSRNRTGRPLQPRFGMDTVSLPLHSAGQSSSRGQVDLGGGRERFCLLMQRTAKCCGHLYRLAYPTNWAFEYQVKAIEKGGRSSWKLNLET